MSGKLNILVSIMAFNAFNLLVTYVAFRALNPGSALNQGTTVLRNLDFVR